MSPPLDLPGAVTSLLGVDPEMWTSIAPHLTCVEAERFAGFLSAAGRADTAADLMAEHLEQDELDGHDHDGDLAEPWHRTGVDDPGR